MKTDPQLSELLAKWPDREPSPGFRDRLMNQLNQPQPKPKGTLLQLHPLWAHAAVALIMLTSGFLLSFDPSPNTRHTNLLDQDTLTARLASLSQENHP